ncbi:hypothetical protein G6F56_004372 [Rhizopus delemar]|nr:hypothetical protein G6F56_004372 [Rhizopus delemar]
MYDLSSADSSIFGEIDVNDLMNTNDQTPKDHEDILSMDEENDSTDTLTQQSSSQQQISHSHSRNSLKAKKIAHSSLSPYSRSTRTKTQTFLGFEEASQ